MQQPLPTGVPPHTAPSFYITGRQPLRPSAVLLAIVLAFAALASVLYALSHNRNPLLAADKSGASRSPNTPGAPQQNEDEDDDPNQVDTIVLGDPADAPTPAKKGDHVSPVHATILVRLPRFGEEVGLIPDSAPGRLLYQWLAAFNKASYPDLANVLPNPALATVTAAQMELRQQTGGYNLLSAREAAPGILVFRLRDQTPDANEALGTLQMQPDSNPPAIASFSLRVIPKAHKDPAAVPVN